MRKLTLLGSVVLFCAAAAARAESPAAQETIFQTAAGSWAVGVVRLGRGLKYRNGELILFPSQIAELEWAPKKTHPRNMMLIHEVQPGETDDKPFLKEDDVIFAPIRLLSEHAYWRDNLPPTRRHQIAGGARSVFRGDDIPEAKKLVGDYLRATDLRGSERVRGEVHAVVTALGAKNAVLRDDAAKFLAGYPNLAAGFQDADVPTVRRYLEGDASATDKARLVDGFAAAKVAAVRPVLDQLASRDDAVGAVALEGLDRLGSAPDTKRLLEMSRSSSLEVQARAAEMLGRRAAREDVAMRRSKEMFLPDGNATVLAAAAKGLGESGGSEEIVAFLATAVSRGDATSGPAASALGSISGAQATAALEKILKEKKGLAAESAARGLHEARDCASCAAILQEQSKSHPDLEVRKVIAVMIATRPDLAD